MSSSSLTIKPSSSLQWYNTTPAYSPSANSSWIPASNASFIVEDLWPTKTIATDCQEQSVSWWNSVIGIQSPYPTSEVSTYLTSSMWYTEVVLGTGDVYTTSDGWARALGNYTPTTSYGTNFEITSSFIWTGSNIIMTPSAYLNASLPPVPNCFIPEDTCKTLYASYASSLGINITAPHDVPFIWPIPTNSPRCESCRSSASTGCDIHGQTVQVFYWPTPSTTVNPGTLVTQVVGDITMTSPSVYLAFDTLWAITWQEEVEVCMSSAMGAANAEPFGSAYADLLISLPPESLSTLEKLIWVGDSPAEVPDSALSALKGTDEAAYSYWVTMLAMSYGVATSKRLTLSDLATPGVRPYYLRPLDFNLPIGCNLQGPHTECNTIWNDVYRAQFSIPAVILDHNPLWKNCSPGIEGVYDPPQALTGETAAASITIAEAIASSPIPAAPEPLAQVIASTTRTLTLETIARSPLHTPLEDGVNVNSADGSNERSPPLLHTISTQINRKPLDHPPDFHILPEDWYGASILSLTASTTYDGDRDVAGISGSEGRSSVTSQSPLSLSNVAMGFLPEEKLGRSNTLLSQVNLGVASHLLDDGEDLTSGSSEKPTMRSTPIHGIAAMKGDGEAALSHHSVGGPAPAANDDALQPWQGSELPAAFDSTLEKQDHPSLTPLEPSWYTESPTAMRSDVTNGARANINTSTSLMVLCLLCNFWLLVVYHV